MNANPCKIYVGNCSYQTTENDLRDMFDQYGNIVDIKLITDFDTGRSKGFGFITFSSAEESNKSLAADGAELGGRKLKVNIAKAREKREGGGGRRN